MKSTRVFPPLIGNQVAVLHAEGMTGILLTTDHSRRALPEDDRYVVFPTAEEARAYALATIRAAPLVEVHLMTTLNQTDETYRDEELLRHHVPPQPSLWAQWREHFRRRGR